MRDKILLAQLVIVLIPIIGFGFLLRQELVPSGQFSLSYTVGQSSPFVDQIVPETRASEPRKTSTGSWVQEVVGDPVYFFIHPHRHFDDVNIKIWFQNKGVPILEIGVLANTNGQIYDLKPLQNTLIDNLDWTRYEKDGLMLFQRETNFDSIQAFIENTPPRSKIATYNYSLDTPYRLLNYSPTNFQQTLDVSLRGFNEFYTYIKNEDLSFVFEYMDMNRKKGAERILINVVNEFGETVADIRADDDGNVDDNAIPSSLESLSLNVPSLPEGVYKIQMQADHDIFFRKIKTTQQKVTFLNHVYLADEVGYREDPRQVNLTTDAKRLQFVTQHASAVQDVQIGSETLSVESPYQSYSYSVEEKDLVSVKIPLGDIRVDASGHIAFTEEQYFNPDATRLQYHTDLDQLGIDYVIASYKPPVTDGEWMIADIQFDASLFAKEDDGTWKFVLSSSGIEELEGSVLVYKMEFNFEREPFNFETLKRFLK